LEPLEKIFTLARQTFALCWVYLQTSCRSFIGRQSWRGVADPDNAKLVLYPVFDSIRRYCEYKRSQRSVAHEKFLEEKAGRERATRLRIEAFNRAQAGELVDKRRLITRLDPIVAAYREQLLARADRLERELALAKGRAKKIQKIRENDLDSLKILSDLFKVASASETGGNGAKAEK
jgi:hypothetical protein